MSSAASPEIDFLSALARAYGGVRPHHVALAVSGGGDSMGLLALAAKAAKAPKGADDAKRFSVLSVDHRLRPAAKHEIDSVAAACAAFGLPHIRLTADKPLRGSDIQQQARRLRYRLMAQWCTAHQADAVVTAHHIEDQAETVLMRLSRGSGIDGLSGMAARQNLMTQSGRLTVLRPFLDISRGDLHAAARTAGLPIAEDPSNHDRRFERVRWRQKLPFLAACGLDVEALAGLAKDMRRIRQSLDAALEAWLKRHAQWHAYGVLMLPRAAYLALPPDKQNRLMRAFVTYFGGKAHPPKRDAVARLAARPAQADSGSATLAGGRLHWRRDTLFLGREAAAIMRQDMQEERQVFDRRFIVTAPREMRQGLYVAGLGSDGVQKLRAVGAVFDKQVPACYHAGLFGFFDETGLLASPIVDTQTGFCAESVYSSSLFRDILGNGQGW